MADSPAAEAGVTEGSVLESEVIEPQNEMLKKISPVSSTELKFVDTTKKSMAYAFWQLQEVPDAKVTLKFQGDDKTYTLEPVPTKEEWYISQR